MAISSKFQSTLPHGERQEVFKPVSATVEISIHAPTRGATKVSVCLKLRLFISIHAPTRGATANFTNNSLPK